MSSIGPKRQPAFRALKARRLVNGVGVDLVPALVAGALAWIGSGHVTIGVSIGLLMFALAKLIARSHFPLRLLPLSQLLLSLAVPLIAVAGVGLLGRAFTGGGVVFGSALATQVVLASWLVVAVATWARSRAEGELPLRVALAGPPEFAVDLDVELTAVGERGYKVVGWLGNPRPPSSTVSLDRLGGADGIRETILENRIDMVVWCVPERAGTFDLGFPVDKEGLEIRDRVAETCLDLPVRLISISQFYERLLGHVPIGAIGSSWYQYLMHPRFRGISPLIKRAFDLAVAVPMAIFTAPVVAVAAVIVRAGDGGPALYRQRRLGEHGEPFEIIKLRSMRIDAEADGRPRWSGADDRRVTAFGRFMRRTHIDELPQLWNVIRGDMTMVGPRPERPEIIAELEREFPHYQRRHLVKPGVTGWAAVRCGYAGSELGTAWKLCHDLFYLKHRTLLVDMVILGETVSVMFRDAHRGLRTPGERFILTEEQRLNV